MNLSDIFKAEIKEQTGEQERRAWLFACRCARETPLADGRTTWDLLTDPRSQDVIEVAERFARGDATSRAELQEAVKAAKDAAAAMNMSAAAAWMVAAVAAAVAAADVAAVAAADMAAVAAADVAADVAADMARMAAKTAQESFLREMLLRERK